ncbi:Uncharacterized protein Adt_26212 [Abeliophyllum distichum]|uniref:Uncharacterized protein n=1 Tax=Abeliophyllum distichum TaxID=126358 RepID=A0ABD1RUA5_9LAMI
MVRADQNGSHTLEIKIHHACSISLHSVSHPIISQVDEHLRRVRSSKATSSLSSTSNRFSGLHNLYDSNDDLLLLPQIQQIISQECQEKGLVKSWTDLYGY